MPTVRLDWTDTNSGAGQEHAVRVYRATAPFTAESLPPVLASLRADTVTYDDTTAEVDSTYYYAVANVRWAESALSFLGPVLTSGITARYWRVRVPRIQSAGPIMALSAAKVEMRGEVGGADLAVGGTPLVSGAFPGNPASSAFDADPATFWVTANERYGTHFIGYDFGTPVSIKEIAWSKRPDTFGSNEAPIIGVVQYSADNVTWTDAWLFETPTTWVTGAETRVFAEVAGSISQKRFWRVRVNAIQSGGSSGGSIAKLEMRTSPGGADAAIGGTPLTSRTGSTHPATNAFDLSNSTRWEQITESGLGRFLGYAFPSEVDIVEVSILPRQNSGGAGAAPVDCTVQSSLNALDWTDEWSFTTPSTWVDGSGETRVFTRPV